MRDDILSPRCIRVFVLGLKAAMPRYVIKLLSSARLVDVRVADYPDMLSAYNDALHGEWQIPRYVEDDGTETRADSFAIHAADDRMLLTVFIKDAFREH